MRKRISSAQNRPTVEQVLTEPAGRQLDAWVGYVLGWRWFKHRLDGLWCFQPPERDGWKRSPWGENVMIKTPWWWPEIGEWYSDWDRCGMLVSDERVVSRGLPKFSTDWAAAGPLLGHRFMVGYFEVGGHPLWEASQTTGKKRTAHGDSGPHALCRAFLITHLEEEDARTDRKVKGGG